jgi:hypothetical protein
MTYGIYSAFVEGFGIFHKYDGYQDLSAEHDVIYAGPDPAKVSDEDVARLEELGWHIDREYDCFRHFV